MTNAEDHVVPPPPAPVRWRELWAKEDWWANWLGLGLVLVSAASQRVVARSASTMAQTPIQTTLLRVQVNMGDVEAMSLEDLAETVIENHRRSSPAKP